MDNRKTTKCVICGEDVREGDSCCDNYDDVKDRVKELEARLTEIYEIADTKAEAQIGWTDIRKIAKQEKNDG